MTTWSGSMASCLDFTASCRVWLLHSAVSDGSHGPGPPAGVMRIGGRHGDRRAHRSRRGGGETLRRRCAPQRPRRAGALMPRLGGAGPRTPPGHDPPLGRRAHRISPRRARLRVRGRGARRLRGVLAVTGGLLAAGRAPRRVVPAHQRQSRRRARVRIAGRGGLDLPARPEPPRDVGQATGPRDRHPPLRRRARQQP